MILTFLYVAFQIVLRKPWLAILGFAVALFLMQLTSARSGHIGVDLSHAAIGTVVVVLMVGLYGPLAFTVMLGSLEVLMSFPLTLDSTVWHGGSSLFAAVLISGLAVYGCLVSARGQPYVEELA